MVRVIELCPRAFVRINSDDAWKPKAFGKVVFVIVVFVVIMQDCFKKGTKKVRICPEVKSLQTFPLKEHL